MAPSSPDSSHASPRAPFATTRWSLVAAAGAGSDAAQEALAELCQAYWRPLYAFARRRGLSPHDAQDATQAFFAHLLESEALGRADPQRGRFRSFLLTSLKHFLVNLWRRERAQRRGGDRRFVSLDFSQAEAWHQSHAAEDGDPQRAFERRWALTLLQRALDRLRGEHESGGKAELFQRLLPHVTGESDDSHRAIAAELGLTEEAVKSAAYRLRKRCRELLRDEVRQTVADAGEVDEELNYLLEVMQP